MFGKKEKNRFFLKNYFFVENVGIWKCQRITRYDFQIRRQIMTPGGVLQKK